MVRSNAADATATAAAICAVDRLVSECCLAVEEDESAVESVGEALDDVIEALDDCKFEPMDGQKDELVLLKNVQVRNRSTICSTVAFRFCFRNVFGFSWTY